MHDLCAKTKWTRFHGTNTEWGKSSSYLKKHGNGFKTDFVEAPSQMLENVNSEFLDNLINVFQ